MSKRWPYNTLSSYKNQQKSRIKLYVLLKKHKATGRILGFRDTVGPYRRWSSSEVGLWSDIRIPLEHLKGGKYTKKFEVPEGWELFIARINSKTCPIEVDISNDSGSLNAPFRVKENL